MTRSIFSSIIIAVDDPVGVRDQVSARVDVVSNKLLPTSEVVLL